MNILSVGFDKSPLLEHLPRRFLLIDDGLIIDQLNLPRAKVFDVLKDSFDPLRKIDHLKARELSDIFYAADPGGENTLTVRNGKRALTKLLLEYDRLDQLSGNLNDPATAEALGVIDNVLLSPAVRRVLTGPDDFRFTVRNEGKRAGATIVARIDRAQLGDFDAFLLGNLLIAQYPGIVVVPDFGFYGVPAHSRLIRQGRLVAGLNFLDEVPRLRNQLLTIPNKIGRHTTPDDAEMLAVYAGLQRGTDGFSTFVQRAIKPRV